MVSALDVKTPSEHRARTLATLAAQLEIQAAQAKAAELIAKQKNEQRMRQFFQDYGPGIAAGDENALTALAREDPEKALELKGKIDSNRKAATDANTAAFDARVKQIDYVQRALTSVLAAAPEVRGIMYKRQLRDYRKQFPDIDFTGIPEEYDENTVKQMLAKVSTASERLAQMQAEKPEKPPTPQGIVTMVSPDGKTSKSFRTGAPELDQAIQDGWTERQGRGQSFRVSTADGTEVEFGDVGDGLRPTTMNRLENNRVDDSNRLNQMARVRAGFKPEFLRIGTRAGMTWSALKDRFGELPEAERTALDEYTTFRADTTEYFNTTIRALTGAALSPGEAARVAATTPVAGEGVFDGDSPTQFKAKMDRSMETIQMAIIRENIWRSQGMKGKPWEAMPLTSVREWVNKRGDEIAKELAKSGMSKAAIAAEVKARLRREVGFGE